MMNFPCFPIVEASGTPYEIGFAHGSGAKERVKVSLDTYKAMFKDFSNIEWEDARERSKGFIAPIEQYSKDLLEELKGVAEGAGVDFLDILALNARSELVLQGAEGQSDGCTAIAVTPEKSKTGDVLIGQNWDWKSTQRDACIILKIRQNNKPDIFMITEAGIIGKLGFNSAGIGVCLNALSADKKPEGLPLHIALRGILDSEILSDAIVAAGRQKLACCANFLVAHTDGEAVNIEVGPDDFDVLYPENGIIAHTNHFLSLRLNNFKDTTKQKFPDTFVRYGRAMKFLKAIDGKVGTEDIKTIFKDHGGYPDSICRHDDLKDPVGLRAATVFSMMINLSKKEVELAFGEPCRAPYIPYRF